MFPVSQVNYFFFAYIIYNFPTWKSSKTEIIYNLFFRSEYFALVSIHDSKLFLSMSRDLQSQSERQFNRWGGSGNLGNEEKPHRGEIYFIEWGAQARMCNGRSTVLTDDWCFRCMFSGVHIRNFCFSWLCQCISPVPEQKLKRNTLT